MLTIITAIALAQASAAQTPAPATPPPAPPGCTGEGYDGFDFWLGEWDVYPNTEGAAKVANSKIERKFNGCAVVENWMPLASPGGTSLNHYDAHTKRWYQKWVGSSPGAVEFDGGVVDGKMVLVGYWPNALGPGQDAKTRMTYTTNEDGSVRQHGESSTDHGVSWQTSFDFIYRPKADGS